jgi:hypothetical protein
MTARKVKTLKYGPRLGEQLQAMNTEQLWQALNAELKSATPRFTMYQRIVSRLKDAVAKQVEKVAMQDLAKRMRR